MNSHPNARWTQRGRHWLVIQHHENGHRLADLVAENLISLRSTFRWLVRYRSVGQASLVVRRSGRNS